jgi:2-oxoisovalerate dehydrogenase E2 component (dihydrolipoyl transacylase)
MVPVIRDAQSKSVWSLAREIARLADAAKTGKAAREELSGSTITLSSLGPMGGVTSTPVINRPKSQSSPSIRCARCRSSSTAT